jgi:hypothetical protein
MVLAILSAVGGCVQVVKVSSRYGVIWARGSQEMVEKALG